MEGGQGVVKGSKREGGGGEEEETIIKDDTVAGDFIELAAHLRQAGEISSRKQMKDINN